MYLKNNLDFSGIKLKLTGRPGVIRSNVRSFSKTYFYGTQTIVSTPASTANSAFFNR